MPKTIVTEYPKLSKKPAVVERWEQLALSADDPQTQMLYVVAVQTYKLRVTVQVALGVFVALVILWALVGGVLVA
ncbi:hypothetical protein [Actinophytocola sp. NPDC049390]|uniref:hypothetical protein n=1 Tax=Actinophytocola sp. NPDC049390 TaxID=3363894 RepID=UPI00379575D2